jgi:hypothetical protein
MDRDVLLKPTVPLPNPLECTKEEYSGDFPKAKLSCEMSDSLEIVVISPNWEKSMLDSTGSLMNTESIVRLKTRVLHSSITRREGSCMPAPQGAGLEISQAKPGCASYRALISY